MPATEAPPAPTTTAPATMTSAPPPATEHAPADFMAQELADFAEMDKAPEFQPGAARGRDDKGRFNKATEKPPEQAPVKAPEEVQKPAEETAIKPGETPPPKSPMRTLGEKYEGLKKQVESEYKPTIQKLQSKVEELTKQAADPAIAERLKAAEARADAAERKLEVEAFTKSQKYVNEYEKPYVDQWNRTAAQFKELTIKEQTGTDELGEPVYQSRPADENDLLKLANLKLSEMDEAVTKMFGASAPRVIQHIEKLKELATARRNAAQTAEETAKKARDEQRTSEETRVKSLANTWTEVNRALEEKFPKAYKPDEGDAEDAAAHTKGFALGDLLFLGEKALRPEQIEALPESFRETLKVKQPLSDAQRVQLHALARLKIANHDRQVERTKKLQARVAQLEKDLADYEKSEPGGRPGAHETKPGEGKDWLETAEAELHALDK